MTVGKAHGVQLPPIRLHHHSSRFFCVGGDAAEGPVCLSLGKIDLVDGRSGTEGLCYGVAPFNDAVGLCLRPLYVVFHVMAPLLCLPAVLPVLKKKAFGFSS